MTVLLLTTNTYSQSSSSPLVSPREPNPWQSCKSPQSSSPASHPKPCSRLLTGFSNLCPVRPFAPSASLETNGPNACNSNLVYQPGTILATPFLSSHFPLPIVTSSFNLRPCKTWPIPSASRIDANKPAAT
ncbi:hypothetical protein TARUN_6001 [Trichoderma arundinaceum]|uniref:Uncharacterized protein n=1 Tax=Trichoderma arundinaceum TaxID=490622 RepID=A0A395NK20_TRIAR|nr:hypothetical protein TARUN_6001 [Trichoderma arundinaceum]